MSKVTPNRALFLGSYWEAIQELETCEQQNDMFWAIINYQAFGELPNFEDTILKVMWKLIVPNVDNSVDRYISSIANGKKGGRPKKTKDNPNKPKITQDNLKQPEERVGSYWKTQQKLKKEIEIENENENENEIETKIEIQTLDELDLILNAKGII
jgi:hypothetical protein